MKLSITFAALAASALAATALPATSQAGGLERVRADMHRVGDRLDALCPLKWLRDHDRRAEPAKPAPKKMAAKKSAKPAPLK